MNSYELVIREHHLDIFGHVNNATYLALFEEARWELITARGYSLQKIVAVKQGPVILEVNLKFLSELRLRDKIQITTNLLGYKGKVGQLEQKMLKEDGTVACSAIFTFGLFDLRTRKLIEPTEDWNHAIGFIG